MNSEEFGSFLPLLRNHFLFYTDVSIASPCDSLSQFTVHFPNDANIIKYLLVVTFNKCGMK